MLTDDIDMISVDDHVIEPPNVWVDRISTRYAEDRPHVVETPATHVQDWVYDGRTFPIRLQGSPQTRIFRSDGTGDDFHSRHYDDMIPAAYDAKERVRSMDEDGVKAAINFPTWPRLCGQTFLEARNKELALLCVRAYNDWMLEEWCATAPDRFIPTIITPLWDPTLGAEEIRRGAAMGAKAVSFTENPDPLGLPSFWNDHWDPVFAAAAETGLPLCMHIGSSSTLVRPSSDASENVSIALCGLNSMSASADLIFSGILNRHPDVKIVLSEGGSGWAPYLVERMDYTWERTRIDTDRSVPPSELFQQHFWTCFISDRTALEMRHLMGADKLMWEGDFPHNDSNYPKSREVFARSVEDIPTEDVRMIAETNARRLFNFGRGDDE